ncbi:hypothetical protein C8Q77DRAFT_1110079 [Trametes polyzona]|nr:hypothetical protein C8Q77DRAFT_1110079 [Trametes polyzona]
MTVEPRSSSSHSFVFFGNRFPCPLEPRFTAEITVHRMSNGSYMLWLVKLLKISLLIPSRGPNSVDGWEIHDIRLFKKDPGEQVGTPGINVALDSGSSHTVLPKDVVDQISYNWLHNDSALVRQYGRIYVDISAPHFDEWDIIFKFENQDGSAVYFRCAAKPFLKSNVVFGSNTNTRPTRFHTPISAPRVPTTTPSYTLGINFHSSAFIRHCGRRPRAPNTSELTAPYVELAPQRAETLQRKLVGPESFVPFSSLPPRFFVEPRET